MADRLGKHLHEVMGWPGPMTHRQFSAWRMWLDRDWNNPNRSDFYAMQIAAAHGVKDPYLRFEDRERQPVNRITKQDYASTTDDPSSWWVPHPLTEAELVAINKQLMSTRTARG